MGVRGSATCPAFDTAPDQLRYVPAHSATATTAKVPGFNMVLSSRQVFQHVGHFSNRPATGTGTGPSGISR